MTQRRFELREGTSNKFWAVEIKGPKVVVRYGRIGSDGQENIKALADAGAARAEAEKLIKSKLAKGYREVSGAKTNGTSVATPPKSAGAKKSASKAPPVNDAGRAAILDKIDTHGLGERRAELERLLRPAVWLRTTEGARSASHLGGEPSLPPDVKWPVIDGRPMSFVGRLVLSELPLAGDALRPEGELLFFILDTYLEDHDEQLDNYASEGRVFYIAERDHGRAKPVKPPAAAGKLMRDGERAKPLFKQRQLSFESVWTLPASSNPIMDKLRLSKKEAQQYDKLWAECFKGRDRHCHQLLGYRHRAYDRSHKPTVRPLLQLRSDPNCDMSWGAQVDDLCFMIGDNELRAQRFDKAFPYLGD